MESPVERTRPLKLSLSNLLKGVAMLKRVQIAIVALALLVASSVPAFGQTGPGVIPRKKTSLPGTCKRDRGDEVIIPSGASAGHWRCSADNTWTKLTDAVATTKGDLIAYGSTPARLPVGVNGQILGADSTQTSGLGWSGPLTLGLLPLFTPANSSLKSLYASNLGSGNVDLYTVPAGKRLILLNAVWSNPTGGSLSASLQVKISSTYTRVGNVIAAASNAYNTTGSLLYTYEAGEVVALNTTGAGLNFWAKAILVDDTVPWKSVKSFAPTTGDNVVYTVPAGKHAIVHHANLHFGLITDGMIQYFNESGSTVTAIEYIIPSGGTKGATSQFFSTTVASSVTSSVGKEIPGVLEPGDQVVVNLSASASVWMWLTVTEY